jgi:hypothetical protein
MDEVAVEVGTRHRLVDQRLGLSLPTGCGRPGSSALTIALAAFRSPGIRSRDGQLGIAAGPSGPALHMQLVDSARVNAGPASGDAEGAADQRIVAKAIANSAQVRTTKGIVSYTVAGHD